MKRLAKLKGNIPWLTAYAWRALRRRSFRQSGAHLVFCLADHFEPGVVLNRGTERADKCEQERRLEVWCREIPRALGPWRDAEGRPFYHTYFYPAEQYDADLIDRLAEHCRAGWGEIEIHLHHGVEEPDTREHTEEQIIRFRDALAKRHGCLSRWNGAGPVRYAFVHGNFALANFRRNRACGVDAEMQVLADTGCYADLTMPSAPNDTQVAKINSLYECGLPLGERAPHRRGKNLRVGRQPSTFPLMIQGPLMLDSSQASRKGFLPHIENSGLTWKYPATMARLRLWERAAITVEGRPDWIFIKLYCHGMDPRDASAMYGAPRETFLREPVRAIPSALHHCAGDDEYHPCCVRRARRKSGRLSRLPPKENRTGMRTKYRADGKLAGWRSEAVSRVAEIGFQNRSELLNENFRCHVKAAERTCAGLQASSILNAAR
jgi:hypothetical protein